MATYYPITGSVTQYQKSNGGFALNYYLKFYAAGTTTAISCAPNASATDENDVPQLLSKVRINEKGNPVNSSGGEMIPHIDQAYKLVLYKSAADANSDNTAAAEWVVDNLSPGLVGFELTQNDQGATEIDYIADATATTRKVDTRLRERISILDFAADKTGAVDSTTAFATALLTGNDLYVPAGTYLCSGIKVLRDNQNIHFDGNVTLKAAANDDIMFHQTGSYCVHTGHFFVNSNGKSGVIGMLVGPSDPTSTIVLDDQTYNTLPGITSLGGEECVVLQPGPRVSGENSWCRYNTFPLVKSFESTRVLYLRSPTIASAALASSNVFTRVIGNGSSVNTVVDIECGSHNTISMLECQDVTSNGSPNSTATGLKIDNTCPVTGLSNEFNTVVHGRFSGCNRDIDNANANTRLLSVDYDVGNSSMTAYPVLLAETTEQIKLYAGRVQSDGTNYHRPPTWSAPTRVSRGIYTINHNIGNSNYVVSITAESTNIDCTGVQSVGSSGFTVYLRAHNSPDLADGAFHYQVMAY